MTPAFQCGVRGYRQAWQLELSGAAGGQKTWPGLVVKRQVLLPRSWRRSRASYSPGAGCVRPRRGRHERVLRTLLQDRAAAHTWDVVVLRHRPPDRFALAVARAPLEPCDGRPVSARYLEDLVWPDCRQFIPVQVTLLPKPSGRCWSEAKMCSVSLRSGTSWN
jgi:hypothetical protein